MKTEARVVGNPPPPPHPGTEVISIQASERDLLANLRILAVNLECFNCPKAEKLFDQLIWFKLSCVTVLVYACVLAILRDARTR